MGVGAVVAYYAADLPDISRAVQAERRPSIVLLAADGTSFQRFGDLTGSVVDAAQLPPHLIHAILAVEDRRFFSHFGIDPIGLARALWTNWRSGRTVQGGSTLTQQLAKNLFLGAEKTLKRKVQEALLALWLERTYSKNQILTAYLNRVYLGAGTFGVDAAARTYFGKPALEVNIREAAMLAGLLKAPSRYSPAANPDEAHQRAQVVLGTMVAAGFLTPAEVEAANKAPPLPRRKPGAGGDGRYFAEWVVDQIDSYIGDSYQDLVIQTTLDLKLQRSAETRLDSLLAGPGVSLGVTQGAAVVMAPDGAVRALIGGRDYAASSFNRATQARRQPGSAFKPFVFLAALESGLTPDSLIEDTPIRIGSWQPANFEKEVRGTVSLTDALAHSINTSTVRLAQQVGLNTVREAARRCGISAPLGKDLSLVLGTSEVTMLELVGAYAGLANGGTSVWPYAIQDIRDREGRSLYKRQGSGGGTIADPGHIASLVRMMKAVVDYGTGKAARLDRPVAGKTGTTSDHRDAWFIGFTADLVAGVWVGNDDNSTMKRVTGGMLPAQLWREIMQEAHAGKPVRPLSPALEVGAGEITPSLPLPGEGPVSLLPPAPASTQPLTAPTKTTSTPARSTAPTSAPITGKHPPVEEEGITGLLKRLTEQGEVRYDPPVNGPARN